MFNRNKVNANKIPVDKVVNQIKSTVDKQLSKKQEEVFKLALFSIKELIVEKYEDYLKTAIDKAVKESVIESNIKK